MARPSFFARVLNLLRGRKAVPTGDGTIRCREALEGLFEFLDGELDAVEAREVEEHLCSCERCYPHLVFEQSFRAAVRRAVQGNAHRKGCAPGSSS